MKRIFWIGRLCIGFGWAKSGTWGVTLVNNEERTYWLGLHTIRHGDKAATSIIFGPLSLTIGYAN